MAQGAGHTQTLPGAPVAQGRQVTPQWKQYVMEKMEKLSGVWARERGVVGKRAEVDTLSLPRGVGGTVYNSLVLLQTQTQSWTCHLAAGFPWLWASTEAQSRKVSLSGLDLLMGCGWWTWEDWEVTTIGVYDVRFGNNPLKNVLHLFT